MINTKGFLSVLIILIITTSCRHGGRQGESFGPEVNGNPPVKDSVIKTIVNVYIENSASMDGYVKGVTEFEQAVYNYLTDIKISNFSDTLNLNYINSKIIPQGSDISDFIEKLEPTNFRLKGGNRGTSDISSVLESIFKDTQKNGMAILVTDGIFSPGRGKSAGEYLVNQQIGIKKSTAEYLKKYPNSSIIVYQLSSYFGGDYYNKEDKISNPNSQRPYYIWVIGQIGQIDQLRQMVPDDKFKGGGIKNVFSITTSNRKVNYAIKRGSGNFDLNKTNPKTTIENLEKETKGSNNVAKFSINVDFKGFLLNDNYLLDNSNYDVSNKAFELSVKKATPNPFGYTHTLSLSSPSVHKGLISIKLKNKLPDWIIAVNDDDGSEPIPNKTFGIKYQIEGVYEAFTFNNNFYTEIKINIK